MLSRLWWPALNLITDGINGHNLGMGQSNNLLYYIPSSGCEDFHIFNDIEAMVTTLDAQTSFSETILVEGHQRSKFDPMVLEKIKM